MIRFIIFRVTGCIATSFFVVTIVFLIMQFLPGDPVHYLLRGYEAEGQVEALRKEFNLDKPFLRSKQCVAFSILLYRKE